MTNKTKLAVGVALATTGGIGIGLSLILYWTSLPRRPSMDESARMLESDFLRAV